MAAHKPERTCCICRRKSTKDTLRRFVWQESTIVLDTFQRLPGRGTYCCLGDCEQVLLKSKKKWKGLFRLR